MGWVLRLVETGVDGASHSVDVMVIDRPGDLGDIAALGLTLSQGKQLVALVQQAIVTAQSRDPTAGLPNLHHPLPDQGLPPPPDRYPVRSGHAPAAPLPLRRLRRGGSGARLAGAVPLDARIRPGPGAVFRPHAVPGRRRRARTPSANRCRERD